jgi:hypothetical protein
VPWPPAYLQSFRDSSACQALYSSPFKASQVYIGI